MTKQTLYIWDLADTLFNEVWNKDRTGFLNYAAWLENKLGRKIKNISVREFEENYEIPYKHGYHFNLDIKPGYKEVLENLSDNEAFTSGNLEQIDWRAEYLNPKVGFDIRKYFKKKYSTFNYAEINI